MRSSLISWFGVALALGVGPWGALSRGSSQAPATTGTVTVRATVSVISQDPRAGSRNEVADRGNAVAWLKPSGETASASGTPSAGTPRFRIVQKTRRFEPRVLAVPVGALVEFPNLDPFFHNVFSLFDGKRFDLGLYESGTSRSVEFSRAGVCYVFCNIHPEMSAVVVVVDSPYYASSSPTGHIAIPNVPPGQYTVSLWHERFQPERETDFPRQVTVAPESASLGTLTLVDTGRVIGPHKNKFGQDYPPPPSTGLPYR